MRLTVIGCSGSFAGPGSPASSYLVRADDPAGRTWHLLLDLGNGALGALQRQVDLADLDAVAISHLHPDHCADLLGLYDGLALTERAANHAGMLPDRILLFRGPLLDMADTVEELEEEVRITVVHEVAHHFGLDDARLHDLGWG